MAVDPVTGKRGRGRPAVDMPARRDLSARIRVVQRAIYPGREGTALMAARIGVSDQTWRRIVTGTASPDPSTALRLVVEVGVHPEFLLRGELPIFEPFGLADRLRRYG